MAKTSITSVTVEYNPYKKNADKVHADVLKFLRERGIEIATGNSRWAIAQGRDSTTGNSGKGSRMLITIGGDGTILYNKQIYDLPIFGIGTESSFLCAAKFGDWPEKLELALKKPKTEKRLMLTGRIGDFTLPNALNEITVRNREHRVIRLKLSAKGREYDFRADGVLFSTPTGSTGYSYSCGGMELDYTARKFQVVGIAPFRRAFSPLLLEGAETAAVQVSPHRSVEVVIDGQFTYPMYSDRLEVFRSRDAELVVV